jgi:glycosyltransferase involved in cell wall biosynthesis
MKVLWLCNRILDDEDGGATGGTWLGAMARGLLDSGAIELGIIGTASVDQFTRADYGQMPQWLVPGNTPKGRDGLPCASLVQKISDAASQFRPDLVHVWGTEGCWGLLTARGLLPFPALLEMQGLKLAIAEVFYGGLAPLQLVQCIGIKEVLKRRTLYDERRDYERWGRMEREMIQGHRFISTQSPWMAAQVQTINPGAHLFKSDRALRTEFEHAPPWQWAAQPVVFTTSAYPSPFKGVHLAIQAVAALRQHCPGVRVRIAGPYQRCGIRQEGYVRWLNGLVRKAGMEAQVEWLGPLSASQSVQELQSAGSVLIPSFVESYCVAMVEAMRIGAPIVAAFSGGTAHLGRDEETCLFFPPGDEAMCTYQLERVLTDQELALRLSRESRKTATLRNDRQRIIQQQLETYRQVARNSSKDISAVPESGTPGKLRSPAPCNNSLP